jgi:hypothetical protein
MRVRASCGSLFELARCAGLRSGENWRERDLRPPDSTAEMRVGWRERTRLKSQRPASARIGELQREVANLTEVIASGLLKSSPALAKHLRSAHGAVDLALNRVAT